MKQTNKTNETNEMNPILVVCEQRDGRLKQAGLEALGAARRLAEPSGRDVIAVLMGSTVEGLAAELGTRGASRVLVANAPVLERYQAEVSASVLATAADRFQPAAIFMAATAMGKDLGPKLAARLRSAFLQDCVAVHMEPDGSVIATRPIYGGKLRAVLKAKSPTCQVVTLRPHAFEAVDPRPGAKVSVESLSIPAGDVRPAATVREFQRAQGTAELTEAAIIVSGGRGLKGPENFKLIEELAAALGGAVGASRAVVDAGWKPHSYQVGLTGKTVSPQLYIACGISGAIQHQAGMSSARTIVAINSNPNAPIFKLAAYGITGDLFEIVPLLTEEVKKLKAGS